MGLGFVGILGDKLPIEEHKAAARKALEAFIKRKEFRGMASRCSGRDQCRRFARLAHGSGGSRCYSRSSQKIISLSFPAQRAARIY